jgi:hypothetical protein
VGGFETRVDIPSDLNEPAAMRRPRRRSRRGADIRTRLELLEVSMTCRPRRSVPSAGPLPRAPTRCRLAHGHRTRAARSAETTHASGGEHSKSVTSAPRAAEAQRGFLRRLPRASGQREGHDRVRGAAARLGTVGRHRDASPVGPGAIMEGDQHMGQVTRGPRLRPPRQCAKGAPP